MKRIQIAERDSVEEQLLLCAYKNVSGFDVERFMNQISTLFCCDAKYFLTAATFRVVEQPKLELCVTLLYCCRGVRILCEKVNDSCL